MENKIPVPTDNIFKFYALFGLTLLVFSFGAALYNNNATNALILTTAVEIDTLKHLESPTRAEAVKLELLEKQKSIAVSDRELFQWALGTTFAIGVLLLCYGFNKWQTLVQPRLDEMAQTELAIAKLQLIKLRREVGMTIVSETHAKGPDSKA